MIPPDVFSLLCNSLKDAIEGTSKTTTEEQEKIDNFLGRYNKDGSLK